MLGVGLAQYEAAGSSKEDSHARKTRFLRLRPGIRSRPLRLLILPALRDQAPRTRHGSRLLDPAIEVIVDSTRNNSAISSFTAQFTADHLTEGLERERLLDVGHAGLLQERLRRRPYYVARDENHLGLMLWL